MTKTLNVKIAPLIITLTILSLGSFAVWLKLHQVEVQRSEILATENLTRAKKLDSEASKLLKTLPQSLSNLIKAKSQFKKAVTLVAEIPSETSVSTEAQILLANYRQKDNLLRQQIDNEYKANAGLKLAQNFAQNAKKLADNPPHTGDIWQEAANQWQEALAQLESIPPNTSFAPVVTKTLKIYRDNYQATVKGLQEEKQAQQNLRQAQEYAQQAATLTEDSAKNPQAWTVAQDKLQQAVRLLKAIPNTSSVYKKGQTTIVEYNDQLNQVVLVIQENFKKSLAEDLMTTINNFIDFENLVANQELTYEEYSDNFSKLKSQFNNLASQPKVQEFTAYDYLSSAFNSYDQVMVTWKRIITQEKLLKQLAEKRQSLERDLLNLSDDQAKYRQAEAQKARIIEQQLNNLNQATQLIQIMRQQSQSARENLINARDNL